MRDRHVVGVIEDDASVRAALLRVFRTAQMDVSLFATAEQYLEHPDRANFDCLVIDVRLPGLGGLDLLEQVQREKPMPALIITAHENEQARNRAMAAGVSGFFLKPFDNRQLLAAVYQAVGINCEEKTMGKPNLGDDRAR